MLTIHHTKNEKNKRDSQIDHTFFLCRNKPLVLYGEQSIVQTYISAIMNGQCTYEQSKIPLHPAILATRIAYFRLETTLHPQQLVKDVIKTYTDEINTHTILKNCGLETKEYTRIKSLTQDESIQLQMQIFLLQKPFLWIFDGPWNLLSSSTQKVIQNLLNTYMQENGCYILATQESTKLFNNYDVHNVENANNEPLITTYLEEDVPLKKREGKPIKTNELSVRKIILSILFVIMLMTTTYLGFIYLFSYQNSMQEYNERIQQMEERSEYPVTAHICSSSYGELQNDFMGRDCTTFSPSQLDDVMKEEFDSNIPVFPMEETYVEITNDTSKSYFTDAQNQLLDFNMNFGNMIYMQTYNFENPFMSGKISERYHEKGIYINEQFAKEVFNGVDLSDVTIHMKLKVPVYSQIQNVESGDGDNAFRYKYILYKEHEIALPIAGITTSFYMYSNMYLDQSIYEEIKQQVGYGKPFDETQEQELELQGLPLFDFDNISIYYPGDFMFLANSDAQANQLVGLLTEQGAQATYYSVMQDREMLIQTQAKVRSCLFPYVIGGLMGVFVLSYLIRKKERSAMIILHKQQVYRQLAFCIGVGIAIAFLFIAVLQFFFEGDFNLFSSMLDFLYSSFGDANYSVLVEILYSLTLHRFTPISLLSIIVFPIVCMSLIYLPEWMKIARNRHK